jgi:hypothetical protein
MYGAVGASGNVTIASSGTSYYPGGLTVGGNISTSGIGINGTSFNSGAGVSFHIGTDWEDKFPDWARIQRMCEQYPGLKIAFEKFKTTYHLVKDHYDTPEDQRPCV